MLHLAAAVRFEGSSDGGVVARRSRVSTRRRRWMRSLGMTAAIVADHGGCVAPLRLKRSAFDADRCLRLYKRPHLGLRPLPEAGFVRRPTGRCRAAERASARPISLPLRQGETREQITLQVSPAGHARYAACFQGLCCPQHHLTRSFLTSRPTPSPRTLTPAGTTPCRRGGDGDGAVWRARRGGSGRGARRVGGATPPTLLKRE